MVNPYQLQAPYVPKGDQPEAIKGLVAGVESGERYQTLLGATGTGKTFTIANVIAQTGRPALVLAHNKTLAAAHSIGRALAQAGCAAPVLCASGLSAVTLPMAIAAGAAGVGVGSAVNKLGDELAMVAVVRSLRDALGSASRVAA